MRKMDLILIAFVVLAFSGVLGAYSPVKKPFKYDASADTFCVSYAGTSKVGSQYLSWRNTEKSYVSPLTKEQCSLYKGTWYVSKAMVGSSEKTSNLCEITAGTIKSNFTYVPSLSYHKGTCGTQTFDGMCDKQKCESANTPYCSYSFQECYVRPGSSVGSGQSVTTPIAIGEKLNVIVEDLNIGQALSNLWNAIVQWFSNII